MDTKNMSRAELLEILITSDGKGKSVKREAFDELEKRAYFQGKNDFISKLKGEE